MGWPEAGRRQLAVRVAGALLTGRWLQGQLYEVGRRDPIAIATVIVLMLLVAAAAALIPLARFVDRSVARAPRRMTSEPI
jgi:hypothetical protein